MTKRPHALCRLCGQVANLCNSHVIPKWCYQNSFNKKHQLKVAATPDLRLKPEQDGYKEYLLCENCEQRFSLLESYAKPILTDGRAPDADREFAYALNGVDAQKIKRFILSVVWRCSVSSSAPFYHIDIGDKHEKNMANALLLDDAIPAQIYPTLIYRLMAGPDALKDLIRSPSIERIEGHRCARVILSGYLFHVFVTSHDVPRDWEGWLLREINWVPIHRVDIGDLPWLKEEWEKLREHEQLQPVLDAERAGQ
ncbi:hypothetical protein [Ferrovibrio xuzhouensis]|uniref:HNH endonuclease n=1 Tax=Ferrovibrio xuzhouensis TaxID=1576914 RepID=A0ABV7V9F5_9PROT